MKPGKPFRSCTDSPPCFAHELDMQEPAETGFDAVQATDVARWRTAERERLTALRLAVPIGERVSVARAVDQELHKHIDHRSESIVSLYWPFRGEPDLRDWMREAIERGSRVALPVVVAKGQPLVFREWKPGCRLERGVWNIPIPADGMQVKPTSVISPLLGYDHDKFRLGYGGGFFDRTLATMETEVQVIGVAHPSAAIRTIYPQWHDIPMDIVLTGERAAPAD